MRASILPNRRHLVAPLLLGTLVAVSTLWVGVVTLRNPYHLPVPATVTRALSLGVVVAAVPFGGVQNAPSMPVLLALGALVNGCAAAAAAAMVAAAGRAARRARRQPSSAHVT